MWSLDAPLVALVWQQVFARMAAVRLRAAEVALLGLGVWLVYSLDRCLESWRVAANAEQTRRHLFHRRHRRGILILDALVAAVCAVLALTGLSREELLAGGILLATTAAHLFSHQHWQRHWRWRVPKEIVVAAVFGAGTLFFPLLRAEENRWLLAGPGGFFMLLCLANCALIALWEERLDRAHGETTLPQHWRGGKRWVRVFPWLLAVAGVPRNGRASA